MMNARFVDDCNVYPTPKLALRGCSGTVALKLVGTHTATGVRRSFVARGSDRTGLAARVCGPLRPPLMRIARSGAHTLFAARLAACSGGAYSSCGSDRPTPPMAGRFTAQVGADNWFSLCVGETRVGEDSVPVITERSFNAETLSFSASYAFVLNVIVKDYKQNHTDLEYTSLTNQQTGDSEFIVQVTDTTTGKVVAASGRAVKCTAIYKAPLRSAYATEASPTLASCGATFVEPPASCKAASVGACGWLGASVYSAAEVGVKDGYNIIAWDASAKLICSAYFKVNNPLLCKLSVNSS
jgi:hypothetical protein